MSYEQEQLDEKAIERLKDKIIMAEAKNLRTKEKSEAQMVSTIKEWIEEEVKCCSNQ